MQWVIGYLQKIVTWMIGYMQTISVEARLCAVLVHSRWMIEYMQKRKAKTVDTRIHEGRTYKSMDNKCIQRESAKTVFEWKRPATRGKRYLHEYKTA